MSNYVKNVDINAATWTALSGLGDDTVQVVNKTTHKITLAVADTTGNIAGALELNPSEAFPFMNVPADAKVWGKIFHPTTHYDKNSDSRVADTMSATVAVYIPS